MIVFLSFRAKRHFVSHVLGYKTNFVNTLKHHRVDLKRAWTNSSWHEIYLFEQLLIEVTPEKNYVKLIRCYINSNVILSLTFKTEGFSHNY